jgi:hydrogenase/urease accessory protein HupE
MRRLLAAAAILWSAGAAAHPLAPALLELREIAPDRFEVLWRTSTLRAQRADVTPVLPSGCGGATPQAVTLEDNDAYVARWTVTCTGGLAGQPVSVHGLEASGINVFVRVERLAGEPWTQLLDAQQPQVTVPPPAASPPVLPEYLALGVTHLLTGFDHVLFIAGLLLLVRGGRRLLWTITAFTAGHSVTLSLATLGLVRVNPALMELGIALSILYLACEAARPAAAPATVFARRPWLIAAGFGLLHGMGFAGALAGVGLPQGEIPLALLGFNLGIELGQLLLIAGWLAAAFALHRSGSTEGWLQRRALPVHALGALAAFWCFERGTALLA